ncbi:NADPH-dependent FMN reductase [Actinophytocola sp.]|jgi:FMN reductase|uniref:NADPH-dependent FMN reductase n=1 Tax=Actinophytocola sp. TaxID=1872138 RepID=UPI002EDBA3C6
MSSIVVLAGSPSATSRTVALAEQLAERLRAQAHDVRVVAVRDLPADALLGADPTNPAIADVLRSVAAAEGVVVASPVYKAAYSGVLKVLLDLLPQLAFAGKAVLPILTGGGPAHALAVDYALRPVLSTLGAQHVVQGAYVLDKHIERTATGITLAADATRPLLDAVDGFSRTLHARPTLVGAP